MFYLTATKEKPFAKLHPHRYIIIIGIGGGLLLLSLMLLLQNMIHQSIHIESAGLIFMGWITRCVYILGK